MWVKSVAFVNVAIVFFCFFLTLDEFNFFNSNSFFAVPVAVASVRRTKAPIVLITSARRSSLKSLGMTMSLGMLLLLFN